VLEVLEPLLLFKLAKDNVRVREDLLPSELCARELFPMEEALLLEELSLELLSTKEF
jgi:hypothetical protein